MKSFLKSSLPAVLALGMFFYVSCGSDDSGGGTKKFASKTEADAALTSATPQITLAISDVKNVSSIAASFGLAKTLAYTYDPATGWWSQSTSSGAYTFDYKHRFTPHDVNGYATNATDKMEYAYDYAYYTSSSGYTYDLSYLSDIVCTGLSGYRASTGNLTVNGSSDIDYDIDFLAGQTMYSYVYSYHNSYSNIAFEQGTTYPVSGSISFTLKFSLTPEIQGYDNYNVAGKITFNGGTTATLEFGGYSYTINLQTGVIS